MSWLFSRVLVEEYLGEVFLDGEPSALLNGNPIPQAYCAPDKMTDFSRLSRFGMTFKPLTANRGKELLTLYLAGFPARTSVLRGGGAGITGSRSGLWKQMARIIGEVRPQYAFIENSPMLTLRGLDTVLCDLASMGFNARWGVVSAADVGAPHCRERIWIVAHSNSDSKSTQPVNAEQICKSDMAHSNVQYGERRGQPCKPISSGGETWIESNGSRSNVAYSNSAYGERDECTERSIEKPTNSREPSWWSSEPNVGRVANGVASRVDRLKAIGNGQVPAVAAAAFQLLSEGL